MAEEIAPFRPSDLRPSDLRPYFAIAFNLSSGGIFSMAYLRAVRGIRCLFLHHKIKYLRLMSLACYLQHPPVTLLNHIIPVLQQQPGNLEDVRQELTSSRRYNK